MSSIDFAIVGFFFLAVFYLGIRERKKLTLDDYYVNSRKTRLGPLTTTVLSTFVGAGAILGLASLTFEGGGLFALVIPLSFFIHFLIFSRFFAPRIKTFGDSHHAYTVPDFFEARYSKRVRIVSAITNLITYGLSLSVQLLAFGLFITTITGISPIVATIVGSTIVILYMAVGGFRADIRTDIFQFFAMILLFVIFTPLLISRAGDFQALQTLPVEFLTGKEFVPFYVYPLALVLIGSTIYTSMDMWQRSYAGESAHTVKRAMGFGSIFAFCFMAMAVLIGVFGRVLLPEVSPNLLVPEVLRMILPTPLFGVALAGFFAAVMSTADTVLLMVSMTVFHDLYEKSFNREIPEGKRMRVTRLMTLAIGFFSLAIALLVFNIAHLTIEAVTFHIVLLPAVLFGFFWKRAEERAAFWSIIGGIIATLVFLKIAPKQAFIPGLFVSLLIFVIVTLISRPKKPENFLSF